MKTKSIGLLAIFLIGLIAVCGIASATVKINEVEFDGTELKENSITTLDVERGEDYTVRVRFESDQDLEDVQVEAYLRGYDHDDLVEDITDVDSIRANVTYSKKLTLKFPQRMDDDIYKLRVRVEGRGDAGTSETYDLDINGDNHVIEIKDIILSPEYSVMSGRALLTSVRLKNYGEKDQDGIKVKVSIPELGLSASDYIDELEKDESTTSEEIYLRIPSCTDEGTYDVDVEVSYDDGDEVVKDSTEITVTADETCKVVSTQPVETGKATIVYDSEMQDVTAGGAGSVYAITMSNPSTSSKTVTVDVNGVDVFGTSRVSPSNVMIIGAGETKTAYIYVSADENAQPGQYSFSAKVNGLGTSAQDISLTANVSAGDSFSVKRALEIGLVVLVVILVVLGLIIGFNKLKNDEEDMDEGKTYY